ncbi:hypothetical protein MMC13_002860 [Lambiella insularis]|nr:hypothetical protein [Lambiella insularis]
MQDGKNSNSPGSRPPLRRLRRDRISDERDHRKERRGSGAPGVDHPRLLDEHGAGRGRGVGDHDGRHAAVFQLHVQSDLRLTVHHPARRTGRLAETARAAGEAAGVWCGDGGVVSAAEASAGTLRAELQKKPDALETRDFWNRIAHRESGGSEPTYYSGWITAFCFWDEKGKLLYDVPREVMEALLRKQDNGSQPLDGSAPAGMLDGDEPLLRGKEWYELHALNPDGAVYHRIDSNEVATGYSKVPVLVNDNGVKFMSCMIAGSVGLKYTSRLPYLVPGRHLVPGQPQHTNFAYK